MEKQAKRSRRVAISVANGRFFDGISARKPLCPKALTWVAIG